MLKEARVQILVEAILKLDIRLLPSDFIGELQIHPGHQLHPLLTRQVNIHNLVTVVADFELFPRPQIIAVLLLVVLAHNAPDRQVVDVHLIPVVILDCVREQLVLAFVQIHAAILGARVVLLESHIDAAELEFNSKQILA